MTANRRTRGTISCISSSRLPTRSGDWIDKPVTLPPGLDKLATKPLPIGSVANAKTIGMADVALLCGRDIGLSVRYDDVHLKSDEFCHDLCGPIVASLSPTIRDRHGAAFNPIELVQALHKSSSPWTRRGSRPRGGLRSVE
jgi:hypothetical protein